MVNIVIMSEMQFEKLDIENKWITMCVCRIMLKKFYIKIQKIEL